MKIENKKNNNFLQIILLSVVVIFIGIFIMSKKQDLDFDEVGTYGLANNTYQLLVEDYKVYSGNELLLNYAAVKDGEEFNISNVFFNQRMDTHPPLHYLLLNFICSLKKGTFSMWYGLIINLLFMVALFWEMRYLFNLVIDDTYVSTILSVISFFTYGFVNELVFIRMYVMLSAISMAFVILIINYIISDKNNKTSKNPNDDKLFLIIFFILCVIGVLTQYHFVFIAFFFSLFLAIELLNNKNIKLLVSTIFVGISSIVVSILIFPGIIDHIFGNNSLHAINGAQVTSISQRFYEILLTIKRSFFGEAFLIYIIVFVVILFIYFFALNSSLKNKLDYKHNTKKTKKVFTKYSISNDNHILENKNVNSNIFIDLIVNNKWYFIFLICVIYYYIVISLTVKFTFARYLYNIYPLIIVCIICPIYQMLKSIKPIFKYFTIVVLLMLTIGSRLKEEPFTLNIKTKPFNDFLDENKDIKILSLYRTIDKNGKKNTINTSLWKLQRPVYTFRNMDKIIFVDISNNKDILYFKDDILTNDDNLFLLIYSGEDDNEILGGIMSNNGYNNVNKIIENTYYHMYILSR